MSKKRHPGEVIIKKPGAGFVGEKLVIRIPTSETLKAEFDPSLPEGWNEESCLICDQDCTEYANVEVLNSQGESIGWACHVSECDMEDKKPI